jgi:hypothetical protein
MADKNETATITINNVFTASKPPSPYKTIYPFVLMKITGGFHYNRI